MLQDADSPDDNAPTMQEDNQATYFEVGLLPPTHPRTFEESSKYLETGGHFSSTANRTGQKRKPIRQNEQQQSILDGLFAISQMQESGELEYFGRKRRRRQIIVMWCEKCGSRENVHISGTNAPFVCQHCNFSQTNSGEQGKPLPNLIPLGKLNNSLSENGCETSEIAPHSPIRTSPPPLMPMPAAAKSREDGTRESQD